MKGFRVLSSALSVLFILSLAQCSSDNSGAPASSSSTDNKKVNPIVVLKGNAMGLSVGAVEVFRQNSPVMWSLTAKDSVAPNGDFSLNIPCPQAGYFKLDAEIAETSMYLTPGDEFSVSIDTMADVAIQFTGGENAGYNTYLAMKKACYSRFMNNENFQLEYSSFSAKAEAMRSDLEAGFAANVKQHSQKDLEKACIDYLLAKVYYIYPRLNKDLKSNAKELPAKYYATHVNVELENLALSDMPEYIDYVTNVVLYTYSDEGGQKEIPMILEDLIKKDALRVKLHDILM